MTGCGRDAARRSPPPGSHPARRGSSRQPVVVIAGSGTWLCSKESSFVTGAAIPVDDGTSV